MVRHLKIGHHRFAKAFFLHVEGVVLTNRHLGSNDVRDGIHHFGELLHERSLLLAELFKFLGIGFNEFFHFVSLLYFFVFEENANLFGDGVALRAKIVGTLLAVAILGVQVDGLIDERQFVILVFLLDVFPDHVGVLD